MTILTDEITLSTLTTVRRVHPDLQELVERKALPDWGRELLLQALQNDKSMVIGGRVNTGKTTVLGALMRDMPGNQKILLLEEGAELGNSLGGQPNVQFIPATFDTPSRPSIITWDYFRLVKPQRLALGEVRGGEGHTMLKAINFGKMVIPNWHGAVCSIHADSTHRILPSLAAYATQHPDSPSHSSSPSDRDDLILNHVISQTIDLVIYVRRYPTTSGVGRTVIDRIAEVSLDDHRKLQLKTRLRYQADEEQFLRD